MMADLAEMLNELWGEGKDTPIRFKGHLVEGLACEQYDTVANVSEFRLFVALGVFQKAVRRTTTPAGVLYVVSSD
jgi:hypothetical protein